MSSKLLYNRDGKLDAVEFIKYSINNVTWGKNQNGKDYSENYIYNNNDQFYNIPARLMNKGLSSHQFTITKEVTSVPPPPPNQFGVVAAIGGPQGISSQDEAAGNTITVDSRWATDAPSIAAEHPSASIYDDVTHSWISPIVDPRAGPKGPLDDINAFFEKLGKIGILIGGIVLLSTVKSIVR